MLRSQSKWWSKGYTQEWWDALQRHEREVFLAGLTPREQEEFFRDWRVWARDDQIMPDWPTMYPERVDEDGKPLDWDTWLMKCGRGYGKTRTAVETILDWVEEGWARRIAIVGQGEDDVRNVMVNGEALALDTPIPTPTGWANFGDLEPGDEVFARDGTVTRVVGVTPIWTDRPCYALVAHGAKPIVADERHKWVTSSRSERRDYRRRKESIRTTGEMSPDVRKRRPDLCEFELPMHKGLLLPDVDLPVPPYTLGAWLGDGDTRGQGTLTCHPDDVATVDHIRADGFEVSERVGSYAWGIRGLKVKLRTAGLLGRKAIPPEYLRSSIRQRHALLQGLMDTDGTISATGQASFDNTNQGLVLQVRELMLSLGYKPGKVMEKPDVRGFKTMYRVAMVGAPGLPAPFRLPRKAERWKPGRRQAGRLVQKIERVASVPVRCIQVEHPTGTFLAGEDFVVTHNSGFMECAPSWNKPNFRPSVGGGVLIWPNGCQAFIYSIADTEALRGPQFHAGWCDEPMAAPRVQRERALDNLEFCLRLGVHPRLILTCTPKPDPWLREIVKKSKDPANRIHLTEGDTYANKRNLAANFLRKIERNYGGTKKGKQEIEGKILGDEEGALFTEETLDKNRQGYEDLDPVEFATTCDKVIIGIDPNTKGLDIQRVSLKKKLAHAAGIIVTGRIGKRKRFVLGDATVSGGPAKWGAAAVLAAQKYDADEFTVEGNQGGDMVKMVLEQAMEEMDFHIPVHINWSKRSKAARAEPVSTIYERGDVHHVGPKSRYEDLEMQMMYLHEGEDPTGEDFDRCDGLVSALARHGLKRRLSSAKSGALGSIRTFGDIAHGAQGNRSSQAASD